MVKDDGSVRADAVDLDIAGTLVRVVCEDPAGVAVLRTALADHLVDEPAPLGFSLRVPAGMTKFHLLVDRSGFILARVGTIQEGLAVLGSHLASLIPPPPGTVRIRARVFLRDDATAALAAFPLVVSQPVIERRLQHASLRIVDRLVVDLRLDTHLVMSAAPWPALRDLPIAPGHARAPAEPTPIDTVLIPRLSRDAPSQADLVAFLAAVTCSGASRADRLALAESLTAKRVAVVPVDDPSVMYAPLRWRPPHI